MPGFQSIKELVEASEAGATRLSTWRKTPSQVTTAGVWFDLSLSPGNPSPQYYAAAPSIAIALAQSSDGGIFHGANVAPQFKFLRRMMVISTTASVVPMPMILCDYLMFYPFIDEGTNDEQPLTNIVTLPRYPEGAGVQIMPVVVAAGAGGAGVTFICTYTNSAGVSGRVTVASALSTQVVNGTIASATATNGLNGPFLPLQAGDSGVRSIQSVTFNGLTDVGLITLVLVKPLAQLSIRGIDAPVEIDYFIDAGGGMPRIVDDAYLNCICHPNGTLANAPIHGLIETTFS